MSETSGKTQILFAVKGLHSIEPAELLTQLVLFSDIPLCWIWLRDYCIACIVCFLWYQTNTVAISRIMRRCAGVGLCIRKWRGASEERPHLSMRCYNVAMLLYASTIYIIKIQLNSQISIRVAFAMEICSLTVWECVVLWFNTIFMLLYRSICALDVCMSFYWNHPVWKHLVLFFVCILVEFVGSWKHLCALPNYKCICK